ncbi:MAG: DUF948 domain-containing protein [Nitrospirota bacterium]
MTVELFLGIIAAVAVMFLVFLIPVILQIKKMVKSAEDFLGAAEKSLTPLLAELTVSIERLNRITEDVEYSVSNVKHLAKAVGDIGSLIEELNNFIKKTGLSFTLKTAGIGAGIKAAVGVLIKGIIKKGGDEDE